MQQFILILKITWWESRQSCVDFAKSCNTRSSVAKQLDKQLANGTFIEHERTNAQFNNISQYEQQPKQRAKLLPAADDGSA